MASDRDLWERACSGEAEAFGDLYERLRAVQSWLARDRFRTAVTLEANLDMYER
jgi:hypothetical protein